MVRHTSPTSPDEEDGLTLGERNALVAQIRAIYPPTAIVHAIIDGGADSDEWRAFTSMPGARLIEETKIAADRLRANERAKKLVDDEKRMAAAGPNALPAGASWAPNEVTQTVEDIQAGVVDRPLPTVGALSSDRALFYAGKVNGVHGESGCGKSWTALTCTAQELTAGEWVIYIDLEDDEVGLVSRLLDMGVEPDDLARLMYLHPDERYDDNAAEALTEVVRDVAPSLVVIDSTGEAMALDGVQPNADEEVAGWFQRLPGRIARMGPAVVVLDHMAKADNGGLWPIGSQRKRAAISGAQYLQKSITPFDKATPGAARLVCAKDRHGTYRVGLAVGELRVDPLGGLDVTMVSAIEEAPMPAADRMMLRVARWIEAEAARTENFQYVLTGAVRKGVQGKSEDIDRAIGRLVDGGFLRLEQRGMAKRLHPVRPYLPEFDEEDVL